MRIASMEARMEERATGVARSIGRATGNRAETSIAEPSAQIQELVEDGDLDSATEEDTGALATEPSLAHLREISSLASWTVSTYKPGCGVAALRSSSTSQFWQSDGPQPHLLNIHFFKLVSIVKLRVHLDFELDESYTPTRMVFLAGMGMYDLTEFAEWVGEAPRGWVDVKLEGVGSGGGDVLKAMVVQVKICENHQNGKDTHVRGVQIFARDGSVRKETERSGCLAEGTERVDEEPMGLEEQQHWMEDPVLR